MGLPAEQPDSAAQPQPRSLPEILPPSRRGARAAARRGGRGAQPPLLISTHLLDGSPPPSPAPMPARSAHSLVKNANPSVENAEERREEMRTLLEGVGVRKAYVLARDYEPEHIEGWVAAWQEDRDGGAGIGPGALAVRIEKWGPPPETPVLEAVVGEDAEADWLERRYQRGRGASLR